MPIPFSTALEQVILSMPGCVGLYMGDEMSGTLARDLTSTNQGVYTGAPALGAPTVTYGDPRPSVTYAASKYVLVKSGAILATLVNASVVAAVRSTRVGGTSGLAIYCERGSSGNDIWKVEQAQTSAANKLRFTHRDDAATLNQLNSTDALNDSKPHIVAVTKAGTAIKFYIDGFANGTGTLTGNDTLTNATIDSRIGADKADTSVNWKDQIGFVALFSRALTAGEVGRISAAALGR
jgi:concanavalin A-like lectin/glucanase superfamily protein